jgi:uncharacterized membrane protein
VLETYNERVARALAISLTLGALAWVVALCAAAALYGSGVFPSIVYGVASLVCHQRPERSFVFAGAQFPVCARCAGLYVSGAVGTLLAWSWLRDDTRHDREFLVIAALPTLATIPVEWLGISALSNAIRLAAAVPLGVVSGWIFVRALRAEAVERSRSSASVAL